MQKHSTQTDIVGHKWSMLHYYYYFSYVMKKPQPYKSKTIQPQLINATLKATGQNYKFHPNNL